MTDTSTPSPAAARRDFELLSQQRQRAVSRLGRERARNARYAIFGAVGFTVVLGIGVQAMWTSTVPVTQPAPPTDARSKDFAATRTGSVVIPTRDEELCREVKFHNDTGKFSSGHTVRCDEAIPAAAPPPANDPNGRATAVRAWFNKH